MREYKIGEIFEYNGEWYQCVRSILTCSACEIPRPCTKIRGLGYCSLNMRDDKEQVVFKKLEKVGEPFIGKVHIQFQRYKIYAKPIVDPTKNIGYVNEENTIAIEIKQTKEDMEEKKQKWGVSSDTMNEINKGIEPMNTSRNIDTERSGAEGIRRNLKPFNLEAAKAGKPVCTRDGRKARIICFDKKYIRPIVALVDHWDEADEEVEGIIECHNDGYYNCREIPSPNDLMMLPEKKEGWVNIYEDMRIYVSEEGAKMGISPERTYITTIKVEWEE